VAVEAMADVQPPLPEVLALQLEADVAVAVGR